MSEPTNVQKVEPRSLIEDALIDAFRKRNLYFSTVGFDEHHAVCRRLAALEKENAELKEVLDRILGAVLSCTGDSGNKINPLWIRDQIKAALTPKEKECEHEFVSARNEVIVSGLYCPKCGAIEKETK